MLSSSSTSDAPLAPFSNHVSFAVPVLAGQTSPAEFVQTHFHTGTYQDEKDKGASFAKGTTCLAFMYSGGIIVSVDSRASQGPYVGSQTVQKVIEINKFL